MNDQFWQIGGATLTRNGEKVSSGLETVIDSGTTLMGAEPDTVDSFYAQIPGSGYDEKYGYYTFPCDSVPELAFNWGGKTWPIDTNKYAPLHSGRISVGIEVCPL